MNYSNINLSNIIYKKPINKKSIILYKNQNNSDMLSLITPELKIVEINNDSIICQIIDNSEIKFIQKLQELDQLNISNTYFNSKEWFKKELSLDIITNYYKTPINNKNIKFNFKKENDVLEIEYIIDNNNNYLSINNLKLNDNIKMKILYNGISFKKNEFNPLIFIQSIKLNSKENNLFTSDDEDYLSSDNEDFENIFNSKNKLDKCALDDKDELDNNTLDDNTLDDNTLDDDELDYDELDELDDDELDDDELENNNKKSKTNKIINNKSKNKSKNNNNFLKIKNKYNK